MQLYSRFHYIGLQKAYIIINQNVGRFHEAVTSHGLTINWGKTNTMVFRGNPLSVK